MEGIMKYFILLVIFILSNKTFVEAAIPTSLQASLVAENEGADLHLGYKSNITVKVAFPAGTTPSATISIMAFTTKLVMALGNTKVVSIGGNILSLTSRYFYSVIGSTVSSGFYTIVGGNMTLENVGNSGSSPNYDDSVITIKTDAYVNSVDDVSDGEQHVIKFKMYNGGSEVWSRDVTFTMRTAIMMQLEKFEVLGTLCEGDVVGNETLQLVFPPHLVNLDAFSETPVSTKDLIRLQALVYMDRSSVDGTSYTVDFVIEVDGAVLWSSTFTFVSTAFVNLPVVTKMKKLPSSNGVAVGLKFFKDVNLTLPEFGVFQINVTMQSLIAGGQGKAGVMMEKMEIVAAARNIRCSSVNVYFTKTGKSKVQNKAVAVIQVTNIGAALPSPGEDRNFVVLRTTAIALPGYTEVGDAHSMECSSDPFNSTDEIDVNFAAKFDQSLVYTVDFYHAESFACMSPNQTFEFFVNITTERDKTPGALYVNFPVEDTMFSVREYRIVHVGQNLMSCFQTIQLDGSLDQYTVHSDGSLSNITLEFPLFCNNMVASDIAADRLTIRIVAGTRTDRQLEGVATGDFTVLVRSSGLLEDVSSSLGIVIQQTTVFDTPSITYGIEIQKTAGFDVEQFVGSCIVEYSKGGSSYHSTLLQLESENGTHVEFTLEDKPVGSHFRLTPKSYQNSSCCVAHRFLTKDLKGDIEIFNDIGGLITANIMAILDGKNETCIQLPVQGQFPPLMWMRMNTTTLWGLGSSAYQLSVFGHGIICNKTSHDTEFKVLYPSSQALGSFHGDVTYCSLNEENVATPNDLSWCSFQCPCIGPHCAEAFLFIATTDSTRNWTLCEVLATN